jgi:hypothetical protein
LFSIKYLHHIVAFRDEKCTKTHLRAFVLQKNFISGSLSLAIGGNREGGEGRLRDNERRRKGRGGARREIPEHPT